MAIAWIRRYLAAGLRVAVLWGVLSPAIGMAAEANSYSDILWMSGTYPPYTWQDDKDGSPQGIFIDVLRAVVGKEVDFKTIVFHPWARSYRMIQTQPMTSLFAMTDTVERRKLFRISAPVLPSVVGIICRKSVIESLKAAGKIAPSYRIGKSLQDDSPLAHLTVGVVHEDIADQLMRQQKIVTKRVVRTPKIDKLMNRLMRGRIDAIAFGHHALSYKLKMLAKTEKSLDPQQFELIYMLGEKPLAFSFHKDTPQALIDRFNARLTQVKAAGTVDAIIQKHLR